MSTKLSKISLLIVFPLGLFLVVATLVYLQISLFLQPVQDNLQINFKEAKAQYRENKNFLPDEENDKNLSLLFFGDLMLDRNVKKILGTSTPDILLSELKKENIFSNRDLISANLEGAVVENGEHWPPTNIYDFSFDTKDVLALKDLGFNFFNLANNHLSDQGEDGIIETEKNLAEMDFSFSGCKDRMIGDCSSVMIERRGKKIGLIGASMVYGNFSEEDLLEKISDLASTTDLLIVQIHWGIEYEHKPSANLISLGHKIIDAGADIIIGHHPHVVGGIEIYENRPIFYSLGNFIFDQYFSLNTQEELGVSVIIKDSKTEISLLPIKSERSFLRPMNEEEKKKFLKKVSSWSFGDELKNQILIGYIELNN